eukprot:COSAG01_NODE_2793_length_7060_cov_5.562563_5_plen_136_part_00
MPEGVLPKAGGVLLRKEALGSSGIGSASAASIERVSAVARIPGVGDSSARLLLPLPSVPSGTSGGHSREGGGGGRAGRGSGCRQRPPTTLVVIDVMVGRNSRPSPSPSPSRGGSPSQGLAQSWARCTWARAGATG